MLGRDRDLAEGAAGRGEQPVDGCLVGTEEERGVVRPAELGIEEGPLGCEPSTRGSSEVNRAIVSSCGTRRSTLAVTRDSTERVVPCALCTASVRSMASAPSSTAAPPAPWQCRSMNPGVR
jgi:hypothetical protein